MKKGTYWLWLGEFLCTTGLAVLLGLQVELYWVVIPVVGLLALKGVEYRCASLGRYESVRHLLDLFESLMPADSGDVRCTYHEPVSRVLGKPKLLRQVLDYVPRGGGGGRKFPIEKGIIGKVFTLRGPRTENFATPEEYRARMRSEYGYTDREVGERTPDRRSYLAYPIVEGGTERVLGVLYFDSNLHQAFQSEPDSNTWRMVEALVQPLKRALA